MFDQIPLIGGALGALIPFVLVLSVVVFIHELGHYLVGRWCGIGAEVFSIGFGPELWARTDRHGTRWRVGALPLGGYVKFVGDEDPASVGSRELSPEERARGFHTASLWRRAATVAAGPFANFLLTILVFAGLTFASGVADDAPVIGSVDAGAGLAPADALQAGDEVLRIDGAPVADFTQIAEALAGAEARELAFELRRDGRRIETSAALHPPARIDALAPGGAAERAGMQIGDVITHVDGAALTGFSELQKIVRESQGRALAMTLRRGDETRQITVTPQIVERTDPVTGEVAPRPMLGVVRQSVDIAPRVLSAGPIDALSSGVSRTWFVITSTLDGIAGLIGGSPEAREGVGGPIRIAQMSGQAADAGAGVLLGLIAVISTSIGLLNLLPIPVLDGGHLLFMGIEAVRGAPPPARLREIATGLGLALILTLMIYASVNDVARLL